MKRNVLVFVLLTSMVGLMAACQQEAKKNTDEKNVTNDLLTQLPGTWEAVSIRADIASVDNTEVDSVFEVSEEYWVEKYTLKPVVYIFQPDKKYRQEFRNNQDSLLNEVKGIWNVFGDTLMMIEPNATYTYQVELAKGMATFSASMDWDGDGQEDDNFQGRYRKVSQSY